MGRKKYREEYCAIAERLAFRGETMEQIADALGCDRTTLYRWRDTHEEMRDALRARDEADDNVEKSLYRQAVAGSTDAAKFWLKNRRSEKWRDKQDVDVSGEVSLFKVKKMKPDA